MRNCDNKESCPQWREVRVKDLGKVVTGTTPSKQESANYGGYIPWVTAADFTGKYIYTSSILLSPRGAQRTRIIPKGSVLVTCIASIGLNAIAGVDLATNQQINTIVVDDQNYDNEFVYYLMCYYADRLKLIAGKTAVPIINKKEFEGLVVKCPDLEWQQSIGRYLSIWDKAIDHLNMLINRKQRLRDRLLRDLVSGLTRIPDYGRSVDCIGCIPKGWSMKKFRELCRIQYGESWGRVKSSEGIPVYGTGGLMGHSKRAISDEPAIIIGRKGTIDKPFYVDHPFWCVDTTFYARTVGDDDLEFLAYKLSILDWKRYNEASGLPSLNRNTLLSITLSMPPIQEQRAISHFLKIMDSELDLLAKKRRLLAEIKKGILSKLFKSIGSGEV
jgi:type I restriction enzyme S subunit